MGTALLIILLALVLIQISRTPPQVIRRILIQTAVLVLIFWLLSNAGPTLKTLYAVSVGLVSCWLLGFTLHGWILVRRVYGVIPIPLIRHTFRLMLITQKRSLFMAGSLGIAVLVASLAYPLVLQAFPVYFQLAFALGGISIVISPPVFLFLGSSTGDTGQLVVTLNEKILPLRLVHLLDSSAMAIREQDQFHVWNAGSRVLPGSDWKQLVTDLMGSVRYLIVDARCVTEHVVWECEQIVSRGSVKRQP